MKFAPLPTVEILRELVDYEPTTGLLRWNERRRTHFRSSGETIRWNNRYAGKPAFNCRTNAGYLSGALFKRLYLAHRVCWTVHTGQEPGIIIDHVNGDRSDNRIANLREATFEQNVGNRLPNRNTSSAFRGVSWCPRDKRWLAYCAGRNLGRFADEVEAALAYNAFASSHYGEFAKLNTIQREFA